MAEINYTVMSSVLDETDLSMNVSIREDEEAVQENVIQQETSIFYNTYPLTLANPQLIIYSTLIHGLLHATLYIAFSLFGKGTSGLDK